VLPGSRRQQPLDRQLALQGTFSSDGLRAWGSYCEATAAPAFGLPEPLARPVDQVVRSCTTDRMFPSGSLNQALSYFGNDDLDYDKRYEACVVFGGWRLQWGFK
jgi:hypothetical protein